LPDSRSSPPTDRAERLQRWFSELAALTHSARRTRIDALAANDPELAEELAALFSQVTINDVENTTERLIEQQAQALPAEIAGFRILDVLGRGGMGVVYLAERAMAETVQRVALKVLAGTYLSPETLAHFYAERRILAALNHPHIATLIEAGTAADGTPYLAMEHIDGKPIDVHARDLSLNRSGRVRLSIAVLSAIAYAHRNLIVHRDLKPSNILVTADGVPKLVDFGIAKLMENGQALTTRSRMYTPEYASPEQMQDLPVTTSADIYGFGVVLHELLTGSRPGKSPAGERAIDASLPHDLRRILARMLENDSGQRYDSAAAVADDLGAHLAGEPLRHARESARERVFKHLRRHRFTWTAAAFALAAILAIGTNMSLSAARLALERDRAIAAQNSAQQVSEFLVSVFEQADPDIAAGKTVTARDLLDAGARRIDGLDKADASAQSQLNEAVGRIYDNLGLPEQALPHYQRALDALRRMPEPSPSKRLLLLRRMSNAHSNMGDMKAAGELLDQAQRELDAHPELPRRESAIMLRARGDHLYQIGEQAEAGKLLEQAQQTFEQLGEINSADYARSLQFRASIFLELGKPREALKMLEKAYAIRVALVGPNNSDSIDTLGQIGRAHRDLGDTDAALQTLTKVMDMRQHVFGPKHPQVAASANELANFYHDQGNVPEAERYYRMALELNRANNGGGTVATAFVLNNLAILIEGVGRFDEAAKLYQESIAIRRKHAGKDDGMRVIKAEQNYAVLLAKLERYDESIALLENAVRLRSAELGADHLDTLISRANLDGVRYQAAPSAARAESSRESWQLLGDALTDQPAARAVYITRMGILLLDVNRLPEAEAAFRQALEYFNSIESPVSAAKATAELGLGLSLFFLNRKAEGVKMIEQARPIAEPALAPNSSVRRRLSEYAAARQS